MSTKSLMLSVRIGMAQRAHQCKANKKHTIFQGEHRLEVKNDQNWDKYCLECGCKIVSKLMKNSSDLMDEFKKYYP